MKNTLASLAITAGIVAASTTTPAQASTVDTFDSSTFISSNVPTPGLFTAGRWNITNSASTGVVPAGTTYIVHFYTMGDTTVNGTGQATVSTYAGARMEVENVNTFRITLTKDLAPWQSVSGIWSEAQNLITNRDGVTLSLESTPAGFSDTNSHNDVYTYDNHGRGF